MTYHNWSDDSFDWKGLSEAIDYIQKWFRFWRIGVMQAKEKFGTARIYLLGGLGVIQFHGLIYPGYCFSQFPKWLWKLDCLCGRWIFRWLNYLIIPFHVWLYRHIYENAVDRWPHLRDEILVDADIQELIEGIHGYKHSDHWTPLGGD